METVVEIQKTFIERQKTEIDYLRKQIDSLQESNLALGNLIDNNRQEQEKQEAMITFLKSEVERLSQNGKNH